MCMKVSSDKCVLKRKTYVSYRVFMIFCKKKPTLWTGYLGHIGEVITLKMTQKLLLSKNHISNVKTVFCRK